MKPTATGLFAVNCVVNLMVVKTVYKDAMTTLLELNCYPLLPEQNDFSADASIIWHAFCLTSQKLRVCSTTNKHMCGSYTENPLKVSSL